MRTCAASATADQVYGVVGLAMHCKTVRLISAATGNAPAPPRAAAN